MNRVAAEIGLERTNFACVHGLSNKSNISTARDIAYLCCIAMREKLFAKIVKTKEFVVEVYNNLEDDTRKIRW